MGALRDMETFPPLGGHQADTQSYRIVCPIGASGATGTLTKHPAGVAIAKNGTGIYDCTGLPITAAGAGQFYFGIYSPGSPPTVGSAVVTSVSLTAGTMTFKTLVGVTVTEPASGDIITIFFVGEGG